MKPRRAQSPWLTATKTGIPLAAAWRHGSKAGHEAMTTPTKVRVAASRRQQGLPLTIQDSGTLAWSAAILTRARRDTGAPKGASANITTKSTATTARQGGRRAHSSP